MPGAPSQAVWRLPTTARTVAITADAGSDYGYTDEILDILSAKGVAASFGITGEWASAHPGAVRRMAAEGHHVINHTYSHPSLTGVSASPALTDPTGRAYELAAADLTLAPLIGHTTKPFWRPPYGDIDDSVLADVGAAGYPWTVMWTIDSLGWNGLPADQIVTRVLDRVEPGAILMFHVGSASQDVAALGTIIDSLRAEGYSFTTVAAALD